MPTQTHVVSGTWVDIKSALSLKDNTDYKFQNLTQQSVYVIEQASQPAPSDKGLVMEYREIHNINPTPDLGVWVKSIGVKTSTVVVREADTASGFESAQQGAFGELITADLYPQAQIHAVYGIRSDVRVVEQFGGTVTAEDGLFRARTGTTAGAVGVAIAKRPLVYRSGQGAVGRCTAQFDMGATGTVLGAGLFSNSEGLYFGYFDDQFSIFHTRKAKASIQVLTLTAPGNGAETATLTIDGTNYNVPLTLTTTQGNAYELEQALRGVVENWEFNQNGSTLVFNQTVPLPTTGAFTYSSTGTSAGSIVETSTGSDTINDIIAQADWNVDTRPDLNPQNINVFQVSYQYLGGGGIDYSIENPETKKFELVHRIKWPNNNQGTTLGNPSLFVGWLARSIGGTTDLSVYGASGMTAIEGKDDSPTNFTGSTVVSQTADGTERSHLQIRNRAVFADTLNLSIVEPIGLSVANDGTKACIIEIYSGQGISDPTNFSYNNEADSVVEISSVQSTLGPPNVAPLISYAVAGQDSQTFNLRVLENEILANEDLLVTTRLQGGSPSDVTVSLVWREIS